MKAEEARRIRVLEYVRIVPEQTEPSARQGAITDQQFRDHLGLLDEWGFTPVTFQDFALIQEGVLSPPRKPIVITIDPLDRAGTECAAATLDDIGMRAVFFVRMQPRRTEGELVRAGDPERYPDEHHILALHDAGHEVGPQAASRPLTEMPSEEAWEEIWRSRVQLEGVLNASVITMAYPFGAVNTEVKKMVQEAGYRFACVGSRGPIRLHEDPLEIRRIVTSSSPSVGMLALRVWGPQTLVSLLGSGNSLPRSTKARP